MTATKREIADKLGVSKGTVVNYIEKLGLESHVERVGQTDMLDDYAVAALADELAKNVPPKQHEGNNAAPVDTVMEALTARIDDLRGENNRLIKQVEGKNAELAALRDSSERQIEKLQMQLSEANARSAKLAERLADIAERQQAIAAAHWWQRGRMVTNLLASGRIENDD